jgi:hypothetical protein
VGPRVGLDVVVKRNILLPAGNKTPLVQPVTIHFTDRYILIFNQKENVLPLFWYLVTLGVMIINAEGIQISL